MKRQFLLMRMLLLFALIVGSGSSVWATTYKLTKVTSVSAGNKYVFEQNNCVLKNSIASSALQTTDTYSKSGLTGSETYIWELESATGGFYLKNVSLNSNPYLNNTSSTTVSFGSKNSIWTIDFTDEIALISNKSNSNRFLGDTSQAGENYLNAYKAYATSNLEDYKHSFTVYLVEEEADVTSLNIASAPSKVRYEIGETLNMTGFSLNADGNSVTSGYTMTIGGTPVENGTTLNSQGKKTIVVSYGGKTVDQEISVGAVTSIAVTKNPTTTEYDAGENFDATGMEVTASLSTGELSDPDTWTKVVTGYTVDPETFVGLETYVTITYAGQSTTLDVTVNRTEVTGVSLNKTSTSITCGSTETLTETITPNDATIKTVSWSSSNESVATVEDGVVTAKAVGTATITVTTTDGEKTATCEVTVTAKNTKPSLINTVFYESFNKCGGTGGNEEPFINGSGDEIASSNLDNTWATTTNTYAANKCARVGTSKNGVLITSNISLTGDATLTFRAAGWSGSATNSYTIAATNCTLSGDTQITTTNAEWNDYTVNITGATGTITVTFTGKRGFIDEVKIVQTKTSVDVTLNASGFASYCSPFALDLTPTENYAAYAVKAVGTSSEKSNAVKFTKITGKVAANTPFIIFNESNANNTVSLPIIEDEDAGITPVPESINALKGTLSPTYVSAPSGYTNFGMSGNKFVPMTAGVVRANKAYLQVNNDDITTGNESRSLQVIFDEETTGISNVEITKPEVKDNVYYNLNGQRVANPSKGLYIVNGKKVIINK